MEKGFKRGWILGGIILLVILTGCTIGGSYYMLNFSLTPNARIRAKDADSYRYLYANYPFLRPWVDSLNQVNALKDTFILNPEGIRLHAYYIAAPKPTPKTAVIVHGYTDNAISMFMIGYLYNHDLQFNILLPDLQHHGESEGPAIQMGWKDRLDVMQWMHVANQIYGDSTRMVVHGISMGGATTMMVAGEEQPEFVKCFVEDCGYTSVWDEFSHELKSAFHLPKFPLMYTTSWLCEQKYGWNFKEASSLKQVEKADLPMFFIHGDKDTYVPTWMVYPLYEAKSDPKELWIVPGAKHAVSYKENKTEYTNRVKNFVDKYIEYKIKVAIFVDDNENYYETNTHFYTAHISLPAFTSAGKDIYRRQYSESTSAKQTPVCVQSSRYFVASSL